MNLQNTKIDKNIISNNKKQRKFEKVKTRKLLHIFKLFNTATSRSTNITDIQFFDNSTILYSILRYSPFIIRFSTATKKDMKS